MILNEKQTKKIMWRLVAECVDFETDEVNCTQLAEMACQELDADYIDGPLDDETHDVWVWAAEVGEAHEKALKSGKVA